MTCHGCAKRRAAIAQAGKTVAATAKAATTAAAATVKTKAAPLRADVAAMAARFAQIRRG